MTNFALWLYGARDFQEDKSDEMIWFSMTMVVGQFQVTFLIDMLAFGVRYFSY
jgi:hypothetical protein